MPLTPSQIAIIKSTIPILAAHGTTITQSFYTTVIQENPSLNSIFSRSHQSTGHQASALAGALYAYASNIDNLGALSSALELICNKHTSLFIQPEHYPIVGTYLLAAMQKILGDALTPEIHDAWKDAYFQLADIMIAKEAEIYSRSEGWTDWKKMRVLKKQVETEDITSFYLVPTDADATTLPSYKPGQYISVRVDVPALGYAQPRQYSLSDAPGKGYFRISVKREKGVSEVHPAYVSTLLHDGVEEGDLIDVSHPMGDFYLDTPSRPASPAVKMTCPFAATAKGEEAEGEVVLPEGHPGVVAPVAEKKEEGEAPLVLISAGVGITPMMSILNTQLGSQEAEKRQITLLHGACTSKLRPFTEDVEVLKGLPNADLETVYFNSQSRRGSADGRNDSPVEEVVGKVEELSIGGEEEQLLFEGRMDLDNEKVKGLLEERGLKHQKTLFFVCGPTEFMTEVRRKLVDGWGIDGERVRLELFGTGGIAA